MPPAPSFAERWRALRRLPRNVFAVSLTSFLMDISSEMVINLLPLYLANVLKVETSLIGFIEGLAETMRLASLCELGRTAVNPVRSTLRYFRDEYLAHIEARACPAGICRALTVYEIAAERCRGCQACLRACPAEAVTGERKGAHAISAERCIGCGACYDACPEQAVRFRPRTSGGADRRAA